MVLGYNIQSDDHTELYQYRTIPIQNYTNTELYQYRTIPTLYQYKI